MKDEVHNKGGAPESRFTVPGVVAHGDIVVRVEVRTALTVCMPSATCQHVMTKVPFLTEVMTATSANFLLVAAAISDVYFLQC